MRPQLKIVTNENASLDAIAAVSLEIMNERDKTERQIKELLESGQDREALRLMRKHLDVQLKVVKK